MYGPVIRLCKCPRVQRAGLPYNVGNETSPEWLNDIKSVLHPFNNSLRLSLFALGYFRKIHGFREGQEKWSDSVEWARDEVPEADLGIFDTISWNAVHSGAPDGQLDWTRLVADEWLSGGIIDEMMVDIQSRVAAIPALDAAVTVAPLTFQREISALSTQGSGSGQGEKNE
ncbi:hypothetical protein B0H17DRAFT_1126521 [Mycena rosella]|uniref:Uncharacterized protein n=1 Tax=Mycena rosella TaxID=1033263 RepID=A0AAD7GTI5_MYCRO|nr:hypothetical protein B0H17DRAFT_1126521 [Mycena rosella]